MIAGPLSDGGREPLVQKKNPATPTRPGYEFGDQLRCSPSHPGGLHIRCWARFPDSRRPTGGAFPSRGQWQACRVRSGYSGGGRAGVAPDFPRPVSVAACMVRFDAGVKRALRSPRSEYVLGRFAGARPRARRTPKLTRARRFSARRVERVVSDGDHFRFSPSLQAMTSSSPRTASSTGMTGCTSNTNAGSIEQNL